jgi:D-alanyl-D-alanine carboxypeptidase/D-alanyl-D-alanine-endopeptidase (penicillin-binding protein 4)
MSWLRLAFAAFAGLLIALAGVPARADGLPPAFTAALAQAGIPLARVAVVVHPLGAAQPILSHNPDAALNPASVMKLVTSFAALHRLGPDFRWTTDVWANGPVVDGVLHGDLVIQGRGDPGLTLERIWLLQRELRARGIHHVRGNLVLDTRHFNLPDYDPARFDGAPFAVYNAAPGALIANYNALALRLTPDGASVRLAAEPALPSLALVSQLAVDDSSECGDWKDALVPALADGGQVLVLDGRYARGCGERTLALNLFEPATTFDLVFRALWAENGGTLAGATVSGDAPAHAPLLSFASEPLAATLVRLNKYSNNVMTRNLFLTLGAEHYGAPATPEKAARAVRELLAARGVDTHKLVLDNGAGLSRIERISARALDQLLQAAWRSPLFAEFESALPLAAVDGTLRRRFNGSPVTGNAHLKTGTLRDVRALAGYVMTAQGGRVSFVMLVNHERASEVEPAQRALLEWVYAEAWKAAEAAP